MTIYAPNQMPAGFTPVLAHTAVGSRLTPESVRYDGTTRQWIMLGDQWESVHPVDQAMMIGCCFRKGSVPANALVGNTVREIVALGSPNLVDDVRNRILSAVPVARLIATSQASMYSIEVDVSSGRLEVEIRYFNLVADPNRNLLKSTVVP